MPSTIHRFRAAFLLIGFLALPATAAHAQRTPGPVAKLDAALSASVSAGRTDATQVIIRTTPNGIIGLTNALAAGGHQIVRVHSIINAITARVPVQALGGLSRNSFVASFSLAAKGTRN